MDLSQFRTFLEIAKTGSYSEAGRRLFLTQPAVSHQMKNLETDLNVVLFERVGNQMKLTDKGELLLDVVNEFLGSLEKVSEDEPNLNTGHLKVSTTSGIMIYLLPNVILHFRQQFPHIKLNLLNWRGSPAEFVQMMSHREVDLAIRPRSNQILTDKLSFLKWRSFGRVLLIPNNHPLRNNPTITLQDIATMPLILYGARTRQSIHEAFSRNKLSYEVIMEIDTAETAKKYVEIGVGASVVDSFALTNEDRHRFQAVDVSRLFGELEYGIYFRKHGYASRSMREFIKLFSPELYAAFCAQ